MIANSHVCFFVDVKLFKLFHFNYKCVKFRCKQRQQFAMNLFSLEKCAHVRIYVDWLFAIV